MSQKVSLFFRVLYARKYPLPIPTENSPSKTLDSQLVNYLLFELWFTLIGWALALFKLGFLCVKYRPTINLFSMLICAKNIHYLFSLIGLNSY